MDRERLLSKLENGLVVSCQIERHAPCYSEDIVELMAKSALWGGACGLRLNGADNVKKVRSFSDAPIIALQKVFRDDTDVFMTPNMGLVDELVQAGADIIALDGTDRPIDGRKAWELIPEVRAKYPELLIFADVRDELDAVEALKLGADMVAPTFYRFKKDAKSADIPDWQMFASMCRNCKDLGKVIMEGKVWTPDDAIRAFHYGAFAVVVGSAITRPHITTRRFCDHIKGFTEKRDLLY